MNKFDTPFNVGDKCTYVFHHHVRPEGKDFTSGEIVYIDEEGIYFKCAPWGTNQISMFKLDGTDRYDLYGQSNPKYDGIIVVGSDRGSFLRVDVPAETVETDSLENERKLAARLRELLTEADEIEQKLLASGYVVTNDMLDNVEDVEELEEGFTYMPITIVRENITYTEI